MDEIETAEAARLLGCTARNVRDRAARGSLPGRRVAGRWVFDRLAINAETHRKVTP